MLLTAKEKLVGGANLMQHKTLMCFGSDWRRSNSDAEQTHLDADWKLKLRSGLSEEEGEVRRSGGHPGLSLATSCWLLWFPHHAPHTLFRHSRQLKSSTAARMSNSFSWLRLQLFSSSSSLISSSMPSCVSAPVHTNLSGPQGPGTGGAVASRNDTQSKKSVKASKQAAVVCPVPSLRLLPPPADVLCVPLEEDVVVSTRGWRVLRLSLELFLTAWALVGSWMWESEDGESPDGLQRSSVSWVGRRSPRLE